MIAQEIIPPTDLEQIPNLPDAAAGALCLWKQLRNGQHLPPRAALNPCTWREWLSDLSIVELREGEHRYFVTLQGGRTSKLTGVDSHKRFLETGLTEDTRSIALAPYIESERTGRPTFSTIRSALGTDDTFVFWRLILPFTSSPVEDGSERVDCFAVWADSSSRLPCDVKTVYESLSRDLASGECGDERACLSLLAD